MSLHHVSTVNISWSWFWHTDVFGSWHWQFCVYLARCTAVHGLRLAVDDILCWLHWLNKVVFPHECINFILWIISLYVDVCITILLKLFVTLCCLLFVFSRLWRTGVYWTAGIRGAPDPELCYLAGSGSMLDPNMSDPARSKPDPNNLVPAGSGSSRIRIQIWPISHGSGSGVIA